MPGAAVCHTNMAATVDIDVLSSESNSGDMTEEMSTMGASFELIELHELAQMQECMLADQHQQTCMRCGTAFTWISGRHHCRACKNIFCSTCSNQSLPLGAGNEQKALAELGVTLAGQALRGMQCWWTGSDATDSRVCCLCFDQRSGEFIVT